MFQNKQDIIQTREIKKIVQAKMTNFLNEVQNIYSNDKIY